VQCKLQEYSGVFFFGFQKNNDTANPVVGKIICVQGYAKRVGKETSPTSKEERNHVDYGQCSSPGWQSRETANAQAHKYAIHNEIVTSREWRLWRAQEQQSPI
jgi:hypothetical protein